MRLPFKTRLAFVVTVVAEITVLALAVTWLGGWATFWLVIATALLGGWVIRKEGLRAWTAVGEALQAGRVAPADDLTSSRAGITGGFLLVLPGFLTDIVGALLVVPATRGWVKATLGRLLPARPPRPPHLGTPPGNGGTMGGRRGPGGAAGGPSSGGPIIEGEVIDPDEPANPDTPDKRE
jgi:UPF0716 protein FxsA